MDMLKKLDYARALAVITEEESGIPVPYTWREEEYERLTELVKLGMGKLWFSKWLDSEISKLEATYNLTEQLIS